jgi:DNA-binding MarR family transcriptional regulator
VTKRVGVDETHDETHEEPDEAERLRLAVARLARRMRQQDVGDLGATATAALASVRERGPLTLGELAAAERVAAPTMTKVVEKLEARGFVTRHVDPSDRRITRVSATDDGNRYLQLTRAVRTAWLAERLDELAPRLRARVTDAIELLEALVAERETQPVPATAARPRRP